MMERGGRSLPTPAKVNTENNGIHIQLMASERRSSSQGEQNRIGAIRFLGFLFEGTVSSQVVNSLSKLPV